MLKKNKCIRFIRRYLCGFLKPEKTNRQQQRELKRALSEMDDTYKATQ